MDKKYWQLIIIGAIAFIAISFSICSGLFFGWKEIYKNEAGLSMRDWLKMEGVVAKSDSPKFKKVYRFVIQTDYEPQKNSEQDALWVSCSGTSSGNCVYFLFTDTPPT